MGNLCDHVDQIARQQNRLVVAAFALGLTLRDTKDRLGHVAFYDLVQSSFSMSRRLAENYIALVDTFGDLETKASYLPLQLLLRVAAPTAPAGFRLSVRKRLRQGERPLPSELLTLLIYARNEADVQSQAEKKRLRRRRHLAWRPRTGRRKSGEFTRIT